MAKYWLIELGDWGFVWEESYSSLNKARKVAVDGMKKYCPQGYAIVESQSRPTLGIGQKRTFMGNVVPVGKKAAWDDGKHKYRINPDGSLGSAAYEMNTYSIRMTKNGKKMPAKKVRASSFEKLRLNMMKVLKPDMTIEFFDEDGDSFGKIQLRKSNGKLIPMYQYSHSTENKWYTIKSDGRVE